MLGHQPNGMLEIAVTGVAAFQSLDPEAALGVVAAAEGEHHGQGDLALAEIIADIFAELSGLPP